jgi:hypothetical protein
MPWRSPRISALELRMIADPARACASRASPRVPGAGWSIPRPGCALRQTLGDLGCGWVAVQRVSAGRRG